jgi:membrane protease YdiL (CAAX protease family)
MTENRIDEFKQLWLELLLLMFFFFLGTGLILVLSPVLGLGKVDELIEIISSSADNLEAFQILKLKKLQILQQFLTFVLPVVLMSVILYKSRWLERLFLMRWTNAGYLLLATALIVFLFPGMSYMYQLGLNFFPADPQKELLMNTMLTMHNFTDYLLNLFMIGVMAAVGEELIFRGALIPLLKGLSKSYWFAIIVSGVFFSLIHDDVAGFIPRAILGIILGISFVHTRSLWTSIVLHFLFNSLQVTALYLAESQVKSLENNATTTHWGLLLFTSITLMFCAFLTTKLFEKAPYSASDNNI